MKSHPSPMKFTNVHLKEIPVDAETSDAHRQVKGYGYVRVQPIPVSNPQLVVCSTNALRLIALQDAPSPDFLQYFSGSIFPAGSDPVANVYCGHQYGFFSGQLGDGTAMTLGTVEGEDGGVLEVQVKGRGPTPFTRPGTDGRKVLRSSIREFLCSEAMYHLGVPTTRAATCVTSDTLVSRDRHYTGEVEEERAALVTRIAPTLLRVGSLQVCLENSEDRLLPAPSPGDIKLMKSILNYVINHFYPQDGTKGEKKRTAKLNEPTSLNPFLQTDTEVKDISEEEGRYLSFFEELIDRTATLVAKWQTIGFCHGVLNTDNVSLMGLTMDYGPFAFMETFDIDHIPNGSDFWARYRYQTQPACMEWALGKLADVISLVVPREDLEDKLKTFMTKYTTVYNELMRKKLGLFEVNDDDSEFFSRLFTIMYHSGADMTLTFRTLTSHLEVIMDGRRSSLEDVVDEVLTHCCNVDYFKHLHSTKPYFKTKLFELTLTVLQQHPELLPVYEASSREAIDRLNDRHIITYAQFLTEEKKGTEDRRLWGQWLREYRARLEKEKMHDHVERVEMMKHSNPRFVLKNHVVQDVIQSAEGGDYKPVQVLLSMVETPYINNPTTKFSDSEELHQISERLLKLHDESARERGFHIT